MIIVFSEDFEILFMLYFGPVRVVLPREPEIRMADIRTDRSASRLIWKCSEKTSSLGKTYYIEHPVNKTHFINGTVELNFQFFMLANMAISYRCYIRR